MRARMEMVERERDEALLMARGATSEGPGTPDLSSTSSAPGHYRRRSLMGDPSPILQSPVRSTPTSSYPPIPPLPMQASSLRTLQSPIGPSSLPPLNTSGQGLNLSSVQLSHVQDLQHQVSTKALALQTLQQEHDRLLAAYSRIQSRHSSLELKYQASESEITNLSEERVKLSASVDALESQVESLTLSRDEARKQSIANGGQYMQIMAMASRLEAQGVSDKSKWKIEQESWTQEREALEARIMQLEKDRAEAMDLATSESVPLSQRVSPEGQSGKSPPDLRKASALNPTSTISPPGASITPVAATSPASASASRVPNESSTESASSGSIAVKDELLENGSVEELREEITRLRKGCAEIDLQLMDLKAEGKRIDQVMQKFQNMGQRVSNKAEHIRSIASGARSLPSE